MAEKKPAGRIRVLVLYNLDPEWNPGDRDHADRASRRLGLALRRQGHSVLFLPVESSDLPQTLASYDPRDVIVLNWCEGLPGVDRSESLVAEILDDLNFTYTGAPPEVLALCYDKPAVKRLLDACRIPTPEWFLVESPDAINGWNRFPAIVKPAHEHSSVGINGASVVMSPDELATQVRHVTESLKQPALVEDFIDGREFHVPLWGNESVEMLPPVEMDFSRCLDIRERLCSYNAKFLPESIDYQQISGVVPARLTEAESAALGAVSIAAYNAIGCRDYGRIDVRLRDGVFYVLDVNPNADITADASVALAADVAGYCYGAMGTRLVAMAVQRHPQNEAPHQ
jgi:D-alanine-D-alanine ligase